MGIIAQAIGNAKGKKNCFWWGFLLGLIGIIVVLCTKGSSGDQYDKLQKLQALKESGAIDEVEYETCKYKIISEINQYNSPYAKPNNSDGTSVAFVAILLIAIVILVIILVPNIINSKDSSSSSSSGDSSLFASKTQKIAKETQKLLEAEWRKQGMAVTVVDDMLVTKRGGNEYSGMITVRYAGKTIQLTGTILYDGYSIQWQPDRQNLLYQMLY